MSSRNKEDFLPSVSFGECNDFYKKTVTLSPDDRFKVFAYHNRLLVQSFLGLPFVRETRSLSPMWMSRVSCSVSY